MYLLPRFHQRNLPVYTVAENLTCEESFSRDLYTNKPEINKSDQELYMYMRTIEALSYLSAVDQLTRLGHHSLDHILILKRDEAKCTSLLLHFVERQIHIDNL